MSRCLFYFLIIHFCFYFLILGSWSVLAESESESVFEDDSIEVQEIKPVELYSQPELLGYIRRGVYLKRIRLDHCQIVADIRDHAQIMKQPAYQFLFAEMLVYGVCVKQDRKRGISLLRNAVRQGLPEAMVRLAQYYHHSTILVSNPEKSVRLSFAASKTGSVPARLLLVELLLEGYGSPRMHPQAYEWLYHSTFNSPKRKRQADILLSKFEKIIPFYVVEHIQNRPEDEF